MYLKETWEAKHGRNHPGVRIKREDSDGSFEVYDEEANGTPQVESTAAEGYRVSVCITSLLHIAPDSYEML